MNITKRRPAASSSQTKSARTCPGQTSQKTESFTFMDYEIRLQTNNKKTLSYLQDQVCYICTNICDRPARICPEQRHIACYSCQEEALANHFSHCGMGCQELLPEPVDATQLTEHNNTILVQCPFSKKCPQSVRLDHLIEFATQESLSPDEANRDFADEHLGQCRFKKNRGIQCQTTPFPPAWKNGGDQELGHRWYPKPSADNWIIERRVHTCDPVLGKAKEARFRWKYDKQSRTITPSMLVQTQTADVTEFFPSPESSWRNRR